MKKILDILTPELCRNPLGGTSYQSKANFFYILVFILSIFMLIKAILSKNYFISYNLSLFYCFLGKHARLIEKPIYNH